MSTIKIFAAVLLALIVFTSGIFGIKAYLDHKEYNSFEASLERTNQALEAYKKSSRRLKGYDY